MQWRGSALCQTRFKCGLVLNHGDFRLTDCQVIHEFAIPSRKDVAGTGDCPRIPTKEGTIMSANTVVRTNVLSLNAHRNLGTVASKQARSSARLSSGYRVNSAADDAAGLAISEKMRAQIRGLDQASRNAQDAISMIRVAEGAFDTIATMVIRIRELAVQGANDTYTQEDRDKIALEVFQLIDEIGEMEERIEFNTMRLLRHTPGSGGSGSIDGMHFQIGANNGNGVIMNFDFDSMRGPYNGTDVSFFFAMQSILNHIGLALQGAAGTNPILGSTFNYSSTDEKLQAEWIAQFINTQADFVLDNVNKIRANLGAWENRLAYTIENLDLASENLSASESRIRDADMAREMMNLTKANVLQQAAISMLAQANQAPNSVLQLLG